MTDRKPLAGGSALAPEDELETTTDYCVNIQLRNVTADPEQIESEAEALGDVASYGIRNADPGFDLLLDGASLEVTDIEPEPPGEL